jgi:hypothetical protein
MDWRINNLTWTTAPFINPETSAVVPAGAAIARSKENLKAWARMGKVRKQ